jgi:hypothetical protein
MGTDWRLKTAAKTGLLFIQRVSDDDAGWGNSWRVYQSSPVVLPAETSGASRRNGWRNENFAYSVSLIRQRIFNMP